MLSIRWRLTLWNMVALAVVLLTFGGLFHDVFHKLVTPDKPRRGVARSGVHGST